MDLFTPSDTRPVHFMGIGGAGMSALALLAARRGVKVTGCDTDPAGAADVAALGATVVAGHDPAHVTGARAVVATAAIPADHPELLAARIAGVPVVPRKRALADLVNPHDLIAIAGTHGKTTTTVMATEMLVAAGKDPTGLAGGRVAQWGGNARIGGDKLFVVEADEYDRAFLELRPQVAVVNNVEADHLEIYGTLNAIEDAFVEFAGRASIALVGTDDAGAARVAARLKTKVWRFGTGDADFRIGPVEQGPKGTSASVRLPDGRRVTIRLPVPGMHNVLNATAALGAVVAVGGDVDAALGALADFHGAGRRFERLGEARGITFIDDYAHHPSELTATLNAMKQAFPGRRLVAVFQPHLYSRTQLLGEQMGKALAGADLAIVADVYAAREQKVEGVTGETVAVAVGYMGGRAIFVPKRDELDEVVAEQVRSGDVVVTLGAGDVTKVGRGLVARWNAS